MMVRSKESRSPSRRAGIGAPARLRAGALAAASVVLLACAASALRAEFAEPVLVIGAEETASEAVIGIDGANNAYVISVVNGSLRIDLIGPNLRSSQSIPGGRIGQAHPAIATNSRGESFIAYDEIDSSLPEIGREIKLSSNNGGRFGNPRNLSLNDLDDFVPRMDLDLDGLPRMTWTQNEVETPELTMVIYYDIHDGLRRELSPGTQPDLAVDLRGFVHIVFARDADLFYVTNNTPTKQFSPELKVVNTPTVAERSPRIAVSDGGEVVVVYIVDNNLMMVTKGPERPFSPQRFLDTGVRDAELRMRESGNTYSIIYEKSGDIVFIRGLSTFLLEPERLQAATAAREHGPSMITDSYGNLHASFLRDGKVYYTNNAQAVEAEFTADRTTGEPPLKVKFEDLTNGSAQIWLWDFGDGEQSSSRNPLHTYRDPGKYTVTLTVFNADRQSTVVKEDFIIVQEPFNKLEIPNMSVVPNQKNVWFPVIAEHKEPIRGFQVMATFDPNVLDFQDCSYDFSHTFAVEPEFSECNEFESRLEIGCLFDFEPPFELKTLPPGDRQTLINLVFDVSPNAAQGAVSEVKLTNDPTISRIFNIFVVDGFSKFPMLTSSTVDIRFVIPPPRFFLRGDVDSSGSIDISDAVKLLNFLFIGGGEPACMDAADLNDRGSVDISGAISILNFLFLGGPAPKVPFPFKGIDPTEDSLTCRG